VQRATGTYPIHVPFHGDPPQLNELLAFFSLAVVGSANELIASGRLRLTAAFSRRRHQNYPEVPTAREQGLDTGQ
jgi:tripartite-type tricarboxylate transporter receptor subunit TctC